MKLTNQSIAIKKKDRKPIRRIETPSKAQAEVLSVFCHRVDARGGTYSKF